MGTPGVTGGLSDRITALSRRPHGARLRRRARPVVDPHMTIVSACADGPDGVR